MASDQGLITNIQRFSLDDGPGIRTTIFLKGCNLRCAWCHNPECLEWRPQLQFNPMTCVHCGRCSAACSEQALVRAGEELRWHSEACRHCGVCASVCPSDTLSMVGRFVAVDELFGLLARDEIYYRKSGGGVTLSGGEPLLQAGFCQSALQRFREAGFHTAVDTAGLVEWTAFELVMPYTSLFLFDLKAMDRALHRSLTCQDNDAIIDNFKRLCDSGVAIWVRVPLVGGKNDTEAEMDSLMELVAKSGIKRVEFLPYHEYGRGKYDLLGFSFDNHELRPPSIERQNEILRKFLDNGIPTQLSVKGGK